MVKMRRATILLRNNEMVLEDPEFVQKFYSSGIGSLERNILKLAPFEVLYLVYTNKACVLDNNGRIIPFDELVRRFQKKDSDVWIKFMVYYDLRRRGLIVMKGYTSGLELRVAESKAEKDRPKIMVFGLVEGRKVKFSDIRLMVDRSTSLGKNIVLAIVDKEGNITYYTISFSRSHIRRSK
ncbi:MAG: hypothetical protein DRJ49_04385 [Thermoprotei archaeon]|nr:MAG: hypothetical protein DRJ49_04385 [Thermoprotei archaeon]